MAWLQLCLRWSCVTTWERLFNFTDDLATALLSETPGRVVVAVDPTNAEAISILAAKHQIALTKIGTTGGSSLTINDAAIGLDELRRAFTDTIPKLFGHSRADLPSILPLDAKKIG